RAIEGELVPVFSGGKLMGFRRKYNDKLLMFCLRHYGQDANGKRTTINYFSTRASAGSGGEGGGAAAEAATTTVRTVITGPATGPGAAANDDQRGGSAAAILGAFEGVVLDEAAAAAIAAALEACAARARTADAAYEQGGEPAALAAADDPGEPFVRADLHQAIAIGALEPPVALDEFVAFVPGEAPWALAGLEMPPERAALEERLSPPPEGPAGAGGKRLGKGSGRGKA
ncbi:MAG: hypothetical protein ABWX67_10125, partial [Allosphingosinicella sp.]